MQKTYIHCSDIIKNRSDYSIHHSDGIFHQLFNLPMYFIHKIQDIKGYHNGNKITLKQFLESFNGEPHVDMNSFHSGSITIIMLHIHVFEIMIDGNICRGNTENIPNYFDHLARNIIDLSEKE